MAVTSRAGGLLDRLGLDRLGLDRLGSVWLHRILVTNVVVQVGIVVTGGVVRLTGSGLGCTTAPECTPGSILPVAHHNRGLHTAVEFTNRMLTTIVVIVAILTAIAVLRTGRRALRGWGVLPVILTFAQAVLGAITVRTGLNPGTVMAHFLLSMVLITVSTVLLVRSGEADGPGQAVVRRELTLLARGAAVMLGAVLVAGTVVTGTGPHAGDADNPPRFHLDLRLISWLHSDLVLVFVGLLVALALGLRLVDGPGPARRAATLLLGLTFAQGVVGYTQYFTGLPAPLVGVHMLLASLLVVAMTRALLSLRQRT
jgi:cytochrome c oxidase assembly protein subunit 15